MINFTFERNKLQMRRRTDFSSRKTCVSGDREQGEKRKKKKMRTNQNSTSEKITPEQVEKWRIFGMKKKLKGTKDFELPSPKEQVRAETECYQSGKHPPKQIADHEDIL